MVGIYKIVNVNNGKVYIGKSIDVYHRKACHEYDLKRGRHYNRHLQMAYNQNPDAFRFDLICKCAEEELNDLEIYFIKKYDSCNPEKGYNVELGGNGSGRVSEETRRKMSLSKIGNTAMKGRVLSDEWKQHLAEAQPHRKRILCVTTGIVYDSFADAARKTGLNRTKIVSVCTGKRKSTGGFAFRYADERSSGSIPDKISG